jgi:RNA polymerase sigma-70 factor, ECF subfamily
MAADPSTVAARYDAVYRFVRKRARSREEAEDLTQDVFLAAIVALNEARLREREPSLAWLYTVAKRRLVDRIRGDSTRPARAL